ncbi:MAG: hypothetical protein OHK0029_23910 [Armatimonadaceae bacterium]
MTKQMHPAAFVGVLIVATILIVGLMTQAMPGTSLAGKRVENGPVVPEFTGELPSGETFRLSDYKGKVVLLNFWATWCPPCIEEIPDLIRLQEKYGDKGLQVVGLSADDSLEVAAEFAKKNGVNYPILIAPPDVARAVGGVQGLPTSVLLDQEGKVVWMMEGMSPTNRPEKVIGNEVERLL